MSDSRTVAAHNFGCGSAVSGKKNPLAGVLPAALFCFAFQAAMALNRLPELRADREARVDGQGVLRWSDDGGEVALLGVNYYTPFTVDYAAVKKLGIDHRQVIREDVAHLRRIGMGCVRLHCFDREFSDAEGNLIDNHHMELLDYLIATCASNGIYTVLTPIAWWGGVYAPGTTHGFSEVYSMHQMTTDPLAWKAQSRFLRQFAGHVNRYTKRRYADDPAVLAFECINEPLYPKGTPDETVTRYINTLADALRSSGTRKPIYYNSWHGRNAAAGRARIDGVTASNYPTGLASGCSLAGSQLHRARGSSLNPDDSIAARSRMVYEFDAADVPGSYMYPVMAKFFRSEGFQVAAQFQYDPVCLADVNRNWMTHHLNLIYTPGKALSLAVAAEVFRRVARGVDFGALPEAAVFPPFRCSDADDISEMVTDTAFIHSNSTQSRPPAPAKLERIWGCGSSPCVTYPGSGAYFLDRVGPGVWRLQIYPDIFQVADPFTGTDQVKVCVVPGVHRITLQLPDLGDSFFFFELEAAGRLVNSRQTREASLDVSPGDYLIVREGIAINSALIERALRRSPPYHAPEPGAAREPLLRVDVPQQWRSETDLRLGLEALFTADASADLYAPDGRVHTLAMKREGEGGVRYSAVVPAELLSSGLWHLRFRASGPGGRSSWPDVDERDVAWLPAEGKPLPLFPPGGGGSLLQGLDRAAHGVKTCEMREGSGRDAAAGAVHLHIDGIADGSSAAGFSGAFDPAAMPREREGMGLRVIASGGERGTAVELGFRMKGGGGVGCNLFLTPGWREYTLPYARMQPLWGLASSEGFRWEHVERISLLTGAWILGERRRQPQEIALQSVEWVRLQPAMPIRIAGEAVAWSLFDVNAWLRVPTWRKPIKRRLTADDRGAPALYVGADGFDADFETLSLRAACDGKSFADLWNTEGAEASIVVRARAGEPQTTACELAFIQSDGTAWGTEIRLSPQWRTVSIPLAELRLFAHWDRQMTGRAGPHLRISDLTHVNLCFGRWLFPGTAGLPHGVEIAEIGLLPGTPANLPGTR